jgi:ketosteroid isomerase-like protein
MKPRVWIAVVVAFCALQGVAQQSTTDKEAVWKLEHSYWEYVKAQDISSYRELWHPNFVGWPSVSSQPVRKDHITDWITSNTAKGLHVGSYTLKPADSQTTGQIVVTHYWITYAWQDKGGSGEPHTLRVTHTWIKTDKGWQIISGMSAAEAEVRK